MVRLRGLVDVQYDPTVGLDASERLVRRSDAFDRRRRTTRGRSTAASSLEAMSATARRFAFSGSSSELTSLIVAFLNSSAHPEGYSFAREHA